MGNCAPLRLELAPYARKHMTAIPPEFDLQSYDFDLPDALIAQDPTEERGACRLAVLDGPPTKSTKAMFPDIADLLPERALLVVFLQVLRPAHWPQTVRRTGGVPADPLA